MDTRTAEAVASARRLAARMVRSPRLLRHLGDGRHVELSLISPPPPRPAPHLVAILLRAATLLAEGGLDEALGRYEERLTDDDQRTWWRMWPGEHYRLLAALVATLGAVKVVEVGTFTGMGTLAMLAGGAEEVVTYDILGWDTFPGTALRPTDLDGPVTQRLADLSDPGWFVDGLDDLTTADLVFIDGPKDGVFEPRFLNLLHENRERLTRPLFVVDDIRTMPLSRTWLDAGWTYLDATSLGHWSGTGLASFGAP